MRNHTISCNVSTKNRFFFSVYIFMSVQRSKAERKTMVYYLVFEWPSPFVLSFSSPPNRSASSIWQTGQVCLYAAQFHLNAMHIDSPNVSLVFGQHCFNRVHCKFIAHIQINASGKENNNAVVVVVLEFIFHQHGKIDRKCLAISSHIQYISSRNSRAPVQNKQPATESPSCASL